MNYFEPRQVDPQADRPDAGRWRYTCMNDGQIWAVGYCAGGCEGHATADDANQHQREYEIDNAWHRVQDGGPGKVEPWDPCEALIGVPEHPCGKRTPNVLTLGPGIGIFGPHLCDEHLTFEGLSSVVMSWEGWPGVVVSS